MSKKSEGLRVDLDNMIWAMTYRDEYDCVVFRVDEESGMLFITDGVKVLDQARVRLSSGTKFTPDERDIEVWKTTCEAWVSLNIDGIPGPGTTLN